LYAHMNNKTIKNKGKIGVKVKKKNKHTYMIQNSRTIINARLIDIHTKTH
jgi:hypothetical protein